MNTVKINISDELELSDIERTLIDNDISYRVRSSKKSTFPKSKNESVDILLSRYDLKTFNRLTNNQYNSIPLDKNPRKKMSIGKILLYAYALIMTILFVKYYFQSKVYEETKNFNNSWNYNGTISTYRWKESNKIHSVFHDINYDLNIEITEGFINGRRSLLTYDKDENGIIEKYIQFDKAGDTSAIFIDINQDEWVDKSIQFLENGHSLILHDIDNNGLFELQEKK